MEPVIGGDIGKQVMCVESTPGGGLEPARSGSSPGHATTDEPSMPAFAADTQLDAYTERSRNLCRSADCSATPPFVRMAVARVRVARSVACPACARRDPMVGTAASPRGGT